VKLLRGFFFIEAGVPELLSLRFLFNGVLNTSSLLAIPTM